ncbi:hypothetical protein GTY62_15215 [Streptomyces sp. SID724]|uniref:hypothetical protein n=1 Tax=Streptomyces sp. SID724 TaxID=2690324 RepID=UPI00136195F9|nr:hypothetical protein [Streptomyces sp. SID724]
MQTTISSTEVARRVGEIFARASRGETFMVTQYGRPYCVITPPPVEQPEAPKQRTARKRAPKKPAP